MLLILAFLVAFLVAMAIAGMALGKYYSQTSGSKHRRERVPQVNHLNEDSQELVGNGYRLGGAIVCPMNIRL